MQIPICSSMCFLVLHCLFSERFPRIIQSAMFQTFGSAIWMESTTYNDSFTAQKLFYVFLKTFSVMVSGYVIWDKSFSAFLYTNCFLSNLSKCQLINFETLILELLTSTSTSSTSFHYILCNSVNVSSNKQDSKTVQCTIRKPINGAKMNDHLINWCLNKESNYSCIMQKDDKPWVYLVYPIIEPIDQSASIVFSEPLLTTDPGLREDSLCKQVSIFNNGILSSFLTFYIYCIASTYDTSVILWFHHSKYHAIFFDLSTNMQR